MLALDLRFQLGADKIYAQIQMLCCGVVVAILVVVADHASENVEPWPVQKITPLRNVGDNSINGFQPQ